MRGIIQLVFLAFALLWPIGISAQPVIQNLTGTPGPNTPPTSTLVPPSSTTAYTTGQLIASSGTAGSIVVPSFSVIGSVNIPRVRLMVADAATGWTGTVVQIDLWSSAPTFTNGDHAAFAIATGTGSHLGTYYVTLTNGGGDGNSGEGAVSPGVYADIASGAGSLYWTAKMVSATTGTITASHNLTLTIED